MPNATALTHCVNGHDLAEVGVYVVTSKKNGRSERCKRCHLDAYERSRKKLRAERGHREELLPREVVRFLSKIRPVESGCWEWGGASKGNGYGVIQVAGRTRLAHRVSYRFHYGDLPEDMDVDHLCRNPICINPEHLEPVTHAENLARGASPSSVATRRIIDAGFQHEARKVGPKLIHI